MRNCTLIVGKLYNMGDRHVFAYVRIKYLNLKVKDTTIVAGPEGVRLNPPPPPLVFKYPMKMK